MNYQILRFTLVVMMSCVTGSAFSHAVVASPPSWGDGAHVHGVIDDQWDKQLVRPISQSSLYTHRCGEFKGR